MDPLSLTASVIAIASLAAQSTKAAYTIIDGLVEAPQVIVHSKNILSGTRNTLDTLNHTLITSSKAPSKLESVIRSIKLDDTLRVTQNLCDNFSTTIAQYTSRSTDARLSNRDRVLLSLHESKIAKFNEQLSDCQRTISLVLGSIILIVSSGTSEDIKQLSIRFQAQEQALATLGAQLFNKPTTSLGVSKSVAPKDGADQNTLPNEQISFQLTATLQDLCQAALSATKARRTGQTFGDTQIYQSLAMQGVVGEAQDGVDQSFGRLTAQNNSRVFQGQMDAGSFAQMFK